MTVNREYYLNGQLAFENPYKDGKYHGVSRGWYEDGKLRYEESYQEGKSHGISRWWDNNGQLQYEYYYLYDNQVTEEDYLKHEAIKKLAGIA